MREATKATAGRFFPELESLRGVAAVTVLVGHCYVFLGGRYPLFPGTDSVSQLLSEVLRGIFHPQPAVMLFFVISGFVLRLQLLQGQGNRYGNFLVRRVFRLFPPMWMSIWFTALIVAWLPVPRPIDAASILNSMAMREVGLNAVLWSLHMEIYCSLCFPLLFWLSQRLGIFGNLVVAAVLAGLMFLPRGPAWLAVIQPGVQLAPQYLVFFQAGLLAGIIGERFPEFPNRRGSSILFLLALVVYAFAPVLLSSSKGYRTYGYWDWMWIEVPACFFLVLYVAHRGKGMVVDLLRLEAMRFIGRISFSLYLLHWPVLIVVLALIKPYEAEWGRLTFFVVAAIVMAETTVLAYLGYVFVEKPFNGPWTQNCAGDATVRAARERPGRLTDWLLTNIEIGNGPRHRCRRGQWGDDANALPAQGAR